MGVADTVTLLGFAQRTRSRRLRPARSSSFPSSKGWIRTSPERGTDDRLNAFSRELEPRETKLNLVSHEIPVFSFSVEVTEPEAEGLTYRQAMTLLGEDRPTSLKACCAP